MYREIADIATPNNAYYFVMKANWSSQSTPISEQLSKIQLIEKEVI